MDSTYMNTMSHTKGIKVVGLLIIAFSLLNVSSTLSGSTNQTINASSYILATLYCTALFVTGVGILKKKPWSRILALVMCLLLTIKLAIGSFKNVRTMYYNSGDITGVLLGVGIFCVFVAPSAWIVFYLTRPSVIAQFSKHHKMEDNQECGIRPPNQAL